MVDCLRCALCLLLSGALMFMRCIARRDMAPGVFLSLVALSFLGLALIA